MNAQIETLRNQIARTAEEHAAVIAKLTAKGRSLLINDAEMIAAYEAFLVSGESYPADSERGIWFPASLIALANGPENGALLERKREDFARDSHQVSECPTWRTRGW